MRIRNYSLSKQKGLASVELALVTPFLLVMLLVSAEFTRVFYEYNTLTKSVRDAARWAANDAYTAGVFNLTSDTISEAKNIAVFGNIAGGGTPLISAFGSPLGVQHITVSQRNLGTAPLILEHVEVSAAYPFQPLAPVISGLSFLPNDIGMNFTLRASSTMRGL